MEFLEEPRFPDSVSEGASGGPCFYTSVFTSGDGTEQRSIMRRRCRHKYRCDLGIRTSDDMAVVKDFLLNVRGKAVGFRFKDWNDYRLTLGNIGTGNGTTTSFQIYKSYVFGALSYRRNLTKIVDNSWTLKVNGATVTTGFTIDIDTGIVTFDVAPANGHAIVITCEFDVPVRLDTEAMDAVHVGYQAQEWSSISMIELLD